MRGSVAALPQPRDGAPPAESAGAKPMEGHAGVWRILSQCEILNFATLRRHLGRPRADALVLDIAARIAELMPDVRILTAGRALIEIGFERESAEAGAADIDRLRKALARPFDLDGEIYTLQMQFGVAAAPCEDCDDVRLTEAAESALEQARNEKKVVILDLSRADLAFDRLTLMRELPRAIANGEMFLQYQPKVHVRRQEIASAEALVRWQHPQRGLILPGDFISVAEEAGEIGALTMWTLRQVIADQKRLVAHGHDLTLFLNISGMLLADAEFVKEACAVVTASGAKLGFEITETAVIRDPDSAIQHLQTFADIGVKLAIDDYGAGLSSLAYLKRLPAKELKIDKMFVMQLTSSNRDPLIVRSTIDLAHALEMEVTAEGVETPSALALLSVMGCDMVQGFLLSRPLGFDAFSKYLADEAHLASSANVQSFIRPESFWKRA
ncbi:bifunctional diguanylate cyclase/phosphodiesterase [Sphingomonas sp. HF-S4]|uniref:Bifunctional diguanylate cyclase/phosphodiesterase n=1 Tax=Sphingomonas agrestis TaxID=3080540 RepID=A0ABU3Y7T6_9SPHN|nr:bifunctional diguanylate cyclase/phosphodiesterase [Sphingomonas sp. HF-S4]MDV3457483.1 bifunctional diguanylate cyclase/phosphodiesterase [Sphingomonas sp. HF-S4]